MYSWQKTAEASRQGRQSPSPTAGLGQSQAARRPNDYGANQSYYWRQRYNNEENGKCIPEPDHDEAFVEESGIKVVQTMSQDDDDDPVNSEEDSEDLSDDEEDPLHELDMWDDTIVEEGEDDDDDEAHSKPHCNDDAKCNGSKSIHASASGKTEANSASVSSKMSSEGNISNEKVATSSNENVSSASSNSSMMGGTSGSSGSTSSNSTIGMDCTKNDSYEKQNQSILNKAIPEKNGTSQSPTIPAAPYGPVPRLNTMPASVTNVKPMGGGFWVGRSNKASRGQNASGQAPQPYSGYQMVPSTGKNKSGRMVLPLARIAAPKHTFIIKKVSEPESPIKRSAVGERRAQEQSLGQTRAARGAASPIWLRRPMENSGPPPKSTQAGDLIVSDAYRKSSDETRSDNDAHKQTPNDQPDAQTFRQRAGTWSMANSRKKNRQEADDEAHIRQRRKSGDDVLNATTKEKKKETTPGFLEAFRPRSKSDAARNKKPNLMTTMKNAVQQTLVSPSTNSKSGRRSGDATPVEQPQNDVYHTWHAGSGTKTTMAKVWDLFKSHRTESTEERHRRKSGGKYDKGQLHRRHSMEPDRRRNASGGSLYIRGEDPKQSALLFRDCRGLPASAAFLENINRSELEKNESQIIVKFFKYHIAYDLIPTSAKLVVFDTKLPVKKAFFALVHNGVRAAPLWDTNRQDYIGMLTITDFIRILQQFYRSKRPMNDLESYDIEEWRRMLNDENRMLVRISPDQSLYEAIKMLITHKIHRLPVIDPVTGNVLYIITHKRILKFLYLYINELPKPTVMQKTLRELGIGTYNNIQTATKHTKLIDALDVFVTHRVSALPIIDEQGKLIDIYAKFDAINLAAKGTYDNLDVTLEEANEYRNEWFEGVLKCTLNETISIIMERIVRAEVHRLVIVDENDVVMGIVSLSDILKELVLKPGEEASEELKEIKLSDVIKQDSPEKDPGTPESSSSEKMALTDESTGADSCTEAVE